MRSDRAVAAPHQAAIARSSWRNLKSAGLKVLTSGFDHQSFLGNPILPMIIRSVPQSKRRGFALKLLGISPHYFTERNSGRYAPSMTEVEVLERELERNIVSRHLLFTDVVAPYLKPEMTALDFGCGAGILANEMAGRCRSMIGVDISCGVLACGSVLFPAQNLQFMPISRQQIRGVASGTVDLLTAIAVIQHMDDATLDRTFAEFRRILKPGGLALCHIPLKENAAATPHATPHQNRRTPVMRLLQRQYGLLMLYRDSRDIEALASRHGMSILSSQLIGTLSTIDDDIRHQQLFVFKRD
jgi:2-polyprenyl-3-methyl-5-hydroxy-6-metoxy-1,4-benzoquinol methylase